MITVWTILLHGPDYGRQVEVPGAGQHPPPSGAAHDGQPGQRVGYQLLLLPGLYTQK